MLSGRIARASAFRSATRRLPVFQTRSFIPSSISGPALAEEKFPDPPRLTEAEDPNQNGGYINPAKVKRQFRDPYGDWWDKQERRNFGEPLHEDYDLLGMFTPHQYTFVSAGKGLAQVAVFIASVVGMSWVIGRVYPDKPTYPREFEGGLERELGGSGALRARAPGDPEPYSTEEAEELD